MLNNDAEKLERYVRDLAMGSGQQAKAMIQMADQMRALFAINSALIAVLRNRLDVDLVRTAALKAFGDDDRDANSIALINSLLRPVDPENTSSLEQVMPNLLRNVERARFTIIHGGRPTDE